MKEKDILDDFIESSDEKKEGSLPFQINTDGSVILIFANKEEHEKLTEEQETKAREYALDKLEKSRQAFLKFTDEINNLSTFFLFSAAITSFAEFASGISEFILSPEMTEEEYEETELAEYIMFETACLLVDEFLYDCYEELESDEKND